MVINGINQVCFLGTGGGDLLFLHNLLQNRHSQLPQLKENISKISDSTWTVSFITMPLMSMVSWHTIWSKFPQELLTTFLHAWTCILALEHLHVQWYIPTIMPSILKFTEIFKGINISMLTKEIPKQRNRQLPSLPLLPSWHQWTQMHPRFWLF